MKLNEIQQQLKAPKGQTNNFGKYKYRSCEDILEAVKPLLGTGTLTISDEVVLVGDRIYVKATTTHTNGEEITQTTGFAREAVDKKGMDVSQIRGAASSYARKYALNGLFCIDDTKDADTQENKPAAAKKATPPNQTSEPATPVKITDIQIENIKLLDEQLKSKDIANDLVGGAKHVSNQQTEKIADLMQHEAATLINLLSKKLAPKT